LKIRIW